MPSFFAQLQQDIALNALAADPFFADGTVTWEQLAWGVLVLTPTADTSLRELTRPYFDSVRVVVQCYVNTETADDATPAALEIAEKVALLLTAWKSTASGCLLAPDKPTLVPTLCYDANGRVMAGVDAWSVNFTTSGAAAHEIPQCATPEITEDAGLVTITCATPGAAVFYSTNGKLPAPRTGTIYTGPFATPDQGMTIRALAWLAGYLPSDYRNPARLTVP